MAGPGDRKDVLLEAGLTLASELSLPVVLQRIVDLAAQLTDARYGAIGVIGERGSLVEFVTTGISARERRQIGALPQGHGVLGLLIQDPRPVRIREIAAHEKTVGFPAHHPAMRSFLGAPVQAMGRVYGNIYLAEKRTADEFSEEDQESLVVLATQAGVAIANASMYEEIRSRERWLDALRDITNQVLGGAERRALLEKVAEHALELASADVATIITMSDTSGELVVSASVGARSAELIGQTMPADRSISGEVMRGGRSLVLADLSSDPRAFQPIVRLGRHGPGLFVPLRVPGGAAGTLMVANLRGGRPFDEETRRIVESFTDQASVALEFDKAQADLRRLGLMEERERIAKELHDGIIQSVFAVGMNLQGTALLAGSPDTAARIESSVEELDKVIRDLRNYIFGLRPGILADRQLDQALRVLGQDLESRSHIKVQMEVDAAVAAALSPRSADIVQLTREALSNVSRHAQASKVRVSLGRRGSTAELAIEDDGVGFDAHHGNVGNGLRNMRERVSAFGATFEISSAAGKGTRLRVRFPIRES
ncbi:MAG TPA: GAF domain-containing sensor histidine kinase [Candidatus Dormibacteraeota bacterium]|nr:GAF domain-containing sensor histidine kinase [Candidatus Dormibacteraeota bacterium]